MSEIKLNQQIVGRAVWSHTGRLVVTRNTFTHAAADVLARALSRQGAFQISHLYLRYNKSTLSPLTPTDGDLRNTIRADFLKAVDGSANGGFYVPLLTAPALTSTDTDKYGSNQLTYYFRVPSTANAEENGLTGGSSWDLDNNRISALGLAVSQDGQDRTSDLIFSVLQGAASGGAFEPFNLVSGGQTALDYPITINF